VFFHIFLGEGGRGGKKITEMDGCKNIGYLKMIYINKITFF